MTFRITRYFLSILVGILFFSCTRKTVDCDTAEMPAVYILFNDSLYKSKYPLNNISISVLSRNIGKDSSEAVIIKDTSSFNLNHVINIGNGVNSNSVVTIELDTHKYIFSDFEIRKAKIETMFGQYYETCIIDSCKMNGEYIKNSPFQIHSGL
jgi:hypothetical protein